MAQDDSAAPTTRTHTHNSIPGNVPPRCISQVRFPVSDTHPVMPDLDELAALFYPSTETLGRFEEVSAVEMPPVFQKLLAHNNHMTVTVEGYHRSPVDVRVLDKTLQGDHYSRKILLARQSDGAVVQYGIVRIDFAQVNPEVRRKIESEGIPLGRVLISHNVLREVELVALWRIEPGTELRDLLGTAPHEVVYGRTALIHVAGEPAVELLEIVTPD
jgi:chorismate-pyruvate lyase